MKRHRFPVVSYVRHPFEPGPVAGDWLFVHEDLTAEWRGRLERVTVRCAQTREPGAEEAIASGIKLNQIGSESVQ
jgi:hypothetical protein